MFSKIKIEEFLEDKKIQEYELLFKEGINLLRKELEDVLKGKKEGEIIEKTIKNAYGEIRQDLIALVPLRFLRKNKINPYPGLVVEIDNMRGIIKSVNGGRVLIDFNHPLAGKEILFKINIIKNFEKEEDFVEELLKNLREKEKEKIEFDKNNKEIIVEKENTKKIIEELLKIYKLENYNVKIMEKKEEKEENNNENKKNER